MSSPMMIAHGPNKWWNERKSRMRMLAKSKVVPKNKLRTYVNKDHLEKSQILPDVVMIYLKYKNKKETNHSGLMNIAPVCTAAADRPRAT